MRLKRTRGHDESLIAIAPRMQIVWDVLEAAKE